MRQRGGQRHNDQFWIVVCPESRVAGGIWRKWYQEGCIAVGWPPPDHGEDKEHEYSFEDEGHPADQTWSGVRNCLREMRVGDKIVPHLMDWRIGPVGTIRALHVKDSEWRPTVGKDTYWVGPDDDCHLSKVCELGRRIDVAWQSQSMPPAGKVAVVPSHRYSRIARRAIQKPFHGRYSSLNLVEFLSDPERWIDLDGL